MEAPILFSEKQRFTQWWVWLIFLGVNGLFIFGVIEQVVLGHQFGDNPIGNTGLLLITGSFFLLTLMFFFSKLETEITKDGLSVRLAPFHIRFKRFGWNQFSKIYVREYSPIAEYGGWGLRYSLSGSGKAYNMSGRMGLQLEFQNGKKLLIGTKKAEELKGVLEKIQISR